MAALLESLINNMKWLGGWHGLGNPNWFLTREVPANAERQAIFDPQDDAMVTGDGAR